MAKKRAELIDVLENVEILKLENPESACQEAVIVEDIVEQVELDVNVPESACQEAVIVEDIVEQVELDVNVPEAVVEVEEHAGMNEAEYIEAVEAECIPTCERLVNLDDPRLDKVLTKREKERILKAIKG